MVPSQNGWVCARGPSCFLPKTDVGIRWLPAYVLEAGKIEADEDSSEPTVLELTLVHSREKFSIQSHNTLLRFKLLERKINLLEEGQAAGQVLRHTALLAAHSQRRAWCSATASGVTLYQLSSSSLTPASKSLKNW